MLENIYFFLRKKTPFYVVSHERSGTHLALNLFFRNLYVSQVFHDFTEWQGPYGDRKKMANHWQAFSGSRSERFKQGGLIKTHAVASICQKYLPDAPIVYVLRDPRDTLVSFFHYLNNPVLYANNPAIEDQRCDSFSEFLQRPLSEYLQYNFSDHGSLSNVMERWSAHVSGWLKVSGVTVVAYEDLKNNYAGCVRRVARKVGAFSKLRMRPVTFGEKGHILPRKGIVGDWKTMFSPEDLRLLGETMSSYDLSFDRWDRQS